MAHYDRSLTLRAAREEYFDRSGFSEGGYTDRWVKLKVGPVIVLAFPNAPARVRSVKLHDLHHVLTEYDTSWTGEAEIGAWELAAGCARHYAAWILNGGAMAIGVLIAPRRTLRAFLRGRRSDTLYRESFSDALLECTVGELRDRLRLGSGA
jgi:hypothetical protein